MLVERGPFSPHRCETSISVADYCHALYQICYQWYLVHWVDVDH